jgi:hypothetical protein
MSTMNYENRHFSGMGVCGEGKKIATRKSNYWGIGRPGIASITRSHYGNGQIPLPIRTGDSFSGRLPPSYRIASESETALPSLMDK